MPGDPHGIQDWMPTIADVMKTQGYATGQFGKNHLGDRDEHLPTKHGFDEFFGNLYHLNAEEEPEGYFYPKDPEFRKKFGPRGVIKSSADGKIEDTGPLNTKRMPTVDEEFLGAAKDFIDRQAKADKPFFVWFNSTRMHVFTHLKTASLGKTGKGIHADGMVEHDGMVGELLKQLDDLKHRRQHDRALHDRQRRRNRAVAGRRHDAVPWREGHDLGRRHAHPDDGALAGRGEARHRSTTTSSR